MTGSLFKGNFWVSLRGGRQISGLGTRRGRRPAPGRATGKRTGSPGPHHSGTVRGAARLGCPGTRLAVEILVLLLRVRTRTDTGRGPSPPRPLADRASASPRVSSLGSLLPPVPPAARTPADGYSPRPHRVGTSTPHLTVEETETQREERPDWEE